MLFRSRVWQLSLRGSMRRGRELAQWPWSAAPQFSGFPVHKDAGCRLQTRLPDSRDQSFFSLDSACELAAQRKPDTQYSPLPHTFLDECVRHGVPKRLSSSFRQPLPSIAESPETSLLKGQTGPFPDWRRGCTASAAGTAFKFRRKRSSRVEAEE